MLINDYADINREIGQYDTNKDRLFLLPKNPMVSVFAEEFDKCVYECESCLLIYWDFEYSYFIEIIVKGSYGEPSENCLQTNKISQYASFSSY